MPSSIPVFTGTADILPFTEHVLREIEGTRLISNGTYTTKLVIEVDGGVARILQKIHNEEGGFEKIILQKEREYVQANILKCYLQMIFPRADIAITPASWTLDIGSGIDAFCTIDDSTCDVDFTSSQRSIQEKLFRWKRKSPEGGKEKWIVFISGNDTNLFLETVHANIDMIHESTFMANIFHALMSSGPHLGCDIYSARGQRLIFSSSDMKWSY